MVQLALLGALLVGGLAQDVPPPQVDPRHKADLERDVSIGKKYAEQVEKEMKISTNADAIARVQRIAAELVPIAKAQQVKVTWGDPRLNPFDYQFKVVAEKDINAFSLPGGYIYVYEGLVDFVESDDELAGVMAHEIAHASLRHIATLEREQSKLQLVTLPLVLIGILSGHGAEFLQLGNLVGMAKGSGWSVQAEEAADYAGFQYMRQSKYNPVGLLTFMERLARRQKYVEGIDMGIFQTHPPSRARADAITEKLIEARVPIRRSLVASSYRVELKPQEPAAVGAWFNGKLIHVFGGDEAMVRAQAAADRLNEFFDAIPDLYDVQVKGATVVGARKALIEVSPSDAKQMNIGPEEAATKAGNAVRASLYNLAYRVWEGR